MCSLWTSYYLGPTVKHSKGKSHLSESWDSSSENTLSSRTLKFIFKSNLEAEPVTSRYQKQKGSHIDKNVRAAKFIGSSFWRGFREVFSIRTSFPFFFVSLSWTLPLGTWKCPSMQWGVSLFVHGGEAAFDKYKTPSLSHFGVFWDFPKQMSWKIHWERTTCCKSNPQILSFSFPLKVQSWEETT